MATTDEKKRREVTILVRDGRKPGWFWQSNEVMDDYVPLMGIIGYGIYGLYCRRVMNDTQSTKIPQEVIRQHFNIKQSTVSEYMKILEWCGLIYVDRKHRSVSEIFC
jgi:replication initiation and membrane attachment protein DnaB